MKRNATTIKVEKILHEIYLVDFKIFKKDFILEEIKIILWQSKNKKEKEKQK